MPYDDPPLDDETLLDFLDKHYTERRARDDALGRGSYDVAFGAFFVTVSTKDTRTFRQLISDVFRRDVIFPMERALRSPGGPTRT
jgi:hypothetical protein